MSSQLIKSDISVYIKETQDHYLSEIQNVNLFYDDK